MSPRHRIGNGLNKLSLWLVALIVVWISARLYLCCGDCISTNPDFPNEMLLRRLNHNYFSLLPVLVNRYHNLKKRVVAPLHHLQCTCIKHGYLCLLPPYFDPDLDITVY